MIHIPETTDTGSAFSYYESSSVGRSLAQDGGAGALAAFTGPVYGLVAALLEQDMARAPRDRRGHRFLELFSLSSASSSSSSVNSFQVCVVSRVCNSLLLLVTRRYRASLSTVRKIVHSVVPAGDNYDCVSIRGETS